MNHRNPIRRAQRGFTLTEILVTTAIFAIIMIAALTVYDQSNKVFKSSTEAADMQQSTRIGFDKLVSDLRMAGFDYSRGGTPNGEGQFPQPDEQIEYAGKTAVVFRANFNYNTAAANGNGLATGYSANNATGSAIFPYVTTDNSEVVGYVLRSTAPGAANGDTISFYVDDAIPRRAYPNVSGVTTGGHAENKVTISGIDLTNNNPPYTLYRVTLADGNCTADCTISVGTVGTPVAENIRSINFRYFTDGSGVTPLFNPPDPTSGAVTKIDKTRNAGALSIDADPASCDPATPSTWVNCTGAIGGDGQFDPANSATANVNDRLQRSTIQAVRVDLTGMNASPEMSYQNPAEQTSTATVGGIPIQNYRSYSLSSLIVPRNLGKTGFPEPSYNPPGPPIITGMCTGHCGAPLIFWSAPTSGGPVVSYRVEWDTNPNGTFQPGFSIGDPTARTAQIPDDGSVPDFSQLVYFHVLALNDNGQSQPSAQYAVRPQNTTKPAAPTNLTATTNQNNQVTLTWTAPTANATGSLSCTGTTNPPAGSPPAIPYPQEIVKYRVVRGTTSTFDPNDPTQRVIVLDYGPGSPQAAGGSTVTWADSPGTSASAPAACIPYFYRVQALDHCSQNANWNVSGSTADAMSAWSDVMQGQATSTSVPSPVPGTPLIFGRGTNSYCLGNGNCQITLQWQKTTTDTAGNAVAVDTYRITRSKRTQGSTGAFVLDTNFNSTGTMDVSGFSQMTTPLWVDRVASPYNLQFADAGGPLEYKYTIAPKICTTYGAESSAVLWPGCTVGITVGASGATGGTGVDPSNPWVLGYSDSLFIGNPAGSSINNVLYRVYAYPSGTLAGTYTSTTGPNYPFTWGDLTDNQVYQIWVTATDNSSPACSETHVVYVRQEQQAACQFNNQTPPTGTGGGGSTYSISGHPSSSENANYNFVIQNNTSATIDVTETAPSAFTGSMDITWKDPCLNNGSLVVCQKSNGTPVTFPELFIKSVEWDVPSNGCASVLTRTSGNSGPIGTNASLSATYGLPTQTICNVPANNGGATTANAKATLKIVFQYDGSNGRPPLPSNPAALLKICIHHKIPTDPTRTQTCNLVGGLGASTANPRACD